MNDNNSAGNDESKKRGRGKPKGSVDTVPLSVEKLAEILLPGTVVPVKRKWLMQYCKFHNVDFAGLEALGQAKQIGEVGSAKDAVVRDRVDVKDEELN